MRQFGGSHIAPGVKMRGSEDIHQDFIVKHRNCLLLAGFCRSYKRTTWILRMRPLTPPLADDGPSGGPHRPHAPARPKPAVDRTCSTAYVLKSLFSLPSWRRLFSCGDSVENQRRVLLAPIFESDAQPAISKHLAYRCFWWRPESRLLPLLSQHASGLGPFPEHKTIQMASPPAMLGK